MSVVHRSELGIMRPKPQNKPTVFTTDISVNTFFYADVIQLNGGQLWDRDHLLLKTQNGIVNLSNGGGIIDTRNVTELRNFRVVDITISVKERE